MGILNIQGSYFSIGNPLQILERCFNPYRYRQSVQFHDYNLDIYWSRRAQRALLARDTPLIVEMQLYFSCVVKKRIIFHDNTDLDSLAVNEHLRLAFRPVEALSCDPVEFAQHYPVKQQFTSPSALKMHPSTLQIDYRSGNWQGCFTI